MSNRQHPVLFEKFEVLETFKKDEFSAVYLVKHHYLGTTLILKTLETKHLPDETILERFKREAKILARIKHRNIINVVDFGFAGDFFYISVEYFESDNLREFLKKNTLTVEQKKHLVAQLLRGIEAAHKAQVIHRDIKPENILVNSRLELKIADFGLAYPENELMVTQKSSIVGTPSYMSPEQIMGEDLTLQSDLFSAGIVAFEIYTQSNPFLKNDINSTINTILSFEPDSLPGWDVVPEDQRELLQKLLQRSKNKRLGSCADALAFFTEDDVVPDNYIVPNQKTPASKYVIAASILVVVLAVVIYIALQNLTSGHTPAQNIVGRDTTTSQQSLLDTLRSNSAVQLSKPMDTDGTPKKENASETAEVDKNAEYLVNVIVDCSPWANVVVDNQNLDVTPVRQTLKLAGGNHVLRFSHPDYPPYSTTFKVERDGQFTYRLQLDTIIAKASFQVFPWGEVYIDGKFFGVTPMKTAVIVAPGKHTVTFKNPGYADFSEKYTFKRGEVREIEYNFEKKQ